MKVLTWNVNKAGESRRELWEMVKRENAEIVLLQEVTRVPEYILNNYQCHLIRPRFFGGHNARFSTAVLSKGLIDATPYLESGLDWVDGIFRERCGWIVGCEVTLRSEERFRVVSVHSPSFPIRRDQYDDGDASAIKLKKNPDLWFTEILWALLRCSIRSHETNWIVGGDFNMSVLLDEPKDRGNQEVIQRLNRLGLIDCLSRSHCGPVATFRAARDGSVEHQLDYCFVNGPMLKRLRRPARVPSHEDVFDRKPRLSDHLPVVCEFD